jgi:hypothetical protein
MSKNYKLHCHGIKKPKNENCDKTAQYLSGTSNFCVGCIPVSSRKNASFSRMEHNILSDITRGLSKKYNLEDLELKYDSVYNDKKRPDLYIKHKNSDDIIMIEVDEKQHFTKENQIKDSERFENFRKYASKKGRTLSVIRIVPNEDSRTGSSMYNIISDNTYGQKLHKSNGYIAKIPKNYNKYIKESVNKISRIIDNDMSYRYKGSEISIGPELSGNASSPIFSDTSSPDTSPTAPKAKYIRKQQNLSMNDLDKKVSTKTSPIKPYQIQYNTPSIVTNDKSYNSENEDVLKSFLIDVFKLFF